MRANSPETRLLTVCLFLLQTVAMAQVATTSLRGTVYDGKGAVISGAAVTIVNPATGFTRTANSDSQGNYQFLELPPSTYDATVNAEGFGLLKQPGLVLLVASPATINFTMRVSSVSVTVEVQGSAPLVNTQDASLGHAFGVDQIADLPFEGRDPAGILSLQTGVVFTGNSSHIANYSDSRSGSVNGARSDQSNVTLDGVDNNDQLLGTAFAGAIRAPLDSLEELKVTTANSQADSGRSSGGQVSLVTKSGTNHFHGSLYAYNRPTFTTANDWFNKAAEIQAGESNTPSFLLRNTFGANVSGPIIKDRLFFFGAYEGQRKREDLQVTRVVPSLAMRAGSITYPCTEDPSCPASGVETLDASQLASMDPVCSSLGSCPNGPGPNPLLANVPYNPNPNALFLQYPTPNSVTVGDGYNYVGYTFPSPLPASQNAFVLKLDYMLTKDGNHRLFVRGIENNDRAAERNISSTPPAGGTVTGDGGVMFPGGPEGQIEHDNNKGFTAGYTATLSNTLINDFRFGYISELVNLQGLETQHFIHFRGLDDINMSTPTINTHVPVKNIVDDLTKVVGAHSFRFGLNYRQVDNLRESNAQSFFTAESNVYWLLNSGMSGVTCPPCSSLEPNGFGFPAVDGSYTGSYDFAVAALVGMIPEVGSNYELDKSLNVLPEGSLVSRHFRDHEYEIYGQDQWRIKPNLTVTYGLRYAILQPPYETTGTQVAPTVSLHDWFLQRGQAAAQGLAYEPQIGFGLAGQANGKQPYWSYDYKDIAPRFAIAYAPKADSGFFHHLFGAPGKTSIRAGYGIYFDHFGEGITNTFDRNGSFGLTTAISNAAGLQTVDGSARFTALNTIPTVSQTPTATCSANCPIVEPPPTGPFPVFAPSGINSGGFAITWGLDDRLKTPYSHVVNFSITRELPSNFVFEASYVGRFAHRLLQEEDLAEPVNLKDPQGGQTYFQAAQALAKQYYANADISTITPALVGNDWQNIFPGASQVFGCAPNSNNLSSFTPTQAMYDLFSCFAGNETSALEFADIPGAAGTSAGPGGCFPACATINGQQTNGSVYYSAQFSSLFAWRSIGNSAYNAGQFSLRHRANGLTFDLNYTISKSIDAGSNAERISEFEGLGFGSQIINSWMPQQNRAVSDFDTTHIINANWVYELPFGRGKRFGASLGRFADALIGGWTVSGLWRWSTGYPFSLFSPAWATNFQLESPAVPVSSARPVTGSYIVAQASGGTGPNVFQDPGITDNNPNSAINLFRPAYPGEAGLRNGLRGPGTFNIDTGLAKSWHVTEGQVVKFSWQMFNVTNTPRFDVGTMSLNGNNSLSSSSVFGNFSSTLSNARVMEFGLRYSF